MFIEDLDAFQKPACPCGENSWTSRFGVGGEHEFYRYDCRKCKRHAFFCVKGSGNVFITATDAGSNIKDTGNAIYEWMQKIVFPLWATRESALYSARREVMARWRKAQCAMVSLPEGSSDMNLSSQEFREEWHEMSGLLDHYRFYRRPRGFETEIIPPELPPMLTAFVLQERRDNSVYWERVPAKPAKDCEEILKRESE